MPHIIIHRVCGLLPTDDPIPLDITNYKSKCIHNVTGVVLPTAAH